MIPTAHLDAVFDLIVAAAVRGERCPQNHEFSPASLPVELARAGRIRIEVFGKNWRQVTIMTGSHAGKKTAPPPFKHRGPYKIIDANGTRHDTRISRILARAVA